MIKEAIVSCVHVFQQKQFLLSSALQSRVEGSWARNKQIWKSNQQPPHPEADLHLIHRSCFIYQ